MWFTLWVFFRALKWLSWIGLAVLSFYVHTHRYQVVNSFGHLLPQYELPLFGFILLAGFAGMLELMAREKAGYARPSFGQLLPPRLR